MNEKKTINIDRELLEEISEFINYVLQDCGEEIDEENLEGRINAILEKG